MDDSRLSGFTLIELLVTLGLVALLTGIAAPAMSRFVENVRLRSAAEHLTGDLQQARNHAISYQRTVYFSLQDNGGDWCFGWSDQKRCDCRNDHGKSNSCLTGKRLQRRLSTDFTGIQLHLARNAQRYTMQFSPLRGIATAGSFHLANRYRGIRIIVSPLGRVRNCPVSSGSHLC